MQDLPPPIQALQSAFALYRQGNLAAAEQAYQSILRTHPKQFEALYFIGLLRLQQGRPVEALASLEAASVLGPQSPDLLTSMAGALMALGRPADALAKLEASLALRPRDADAHFNRGVILAALGRSDAAMAAYRAALAIRPDHLPSLFNLGNAQAAAARYAEALDCYDRILAAVPNHVDVLTNSASALAKLGRLEEALRRFDRVLAANPHSVLALTNRANTLKELGQFDRALADYARVLAADPGNADALFNRGNALIDLGRPLEAIEDLRRAVALRPQAANIRVSYANALFDARRPEDAVAEFRRALDLAPDDAEIHTRLIFALNFDSSTTTADHQAERARWARRHQSLSATAVPHANSPDPDRRLRIGYVSRYFRAQAATFSFAGPLIGHDPRQFDVVCYSDTDTEDDVTDRLRAGATKWHRTAALSDDQLAALVRADGIDILVDLVGHMRGHRLAVFARKPAPIQVTAWGEPTGTGLAAIDYLFADPVLVPQAERALLAERVFDLPNFLGYWTPDALPEPGPLPASSRGYVTFGSFNRLSKVLDPVLRVWAEILRAVPNSRLILKDGVFEGESRNAPILECLAAEGVGADRITLLGRTDRAGLFAAYRDVDIALDPFPHAGGMTTLDALWMGAPVVTRPGRTISSRLAAATLTALGLTDLIAADVENYVATAVALAADPDSLGRLRRRLRPLLAASPVGDPQLYARAVEAAYREVWRRWCASR